MIPEKTLKKYDGFMISYQYKFPRDYDIITLLSDKWWRRDKVYKFEREVPFRKTPGFRYAFDQVTNFFKRKILANETEINNEH